MFKPVRSLNLSPLDDDDPICFGDFISFKVYDLNQEISDNQDSSSYFVLDGPYSNRVKNKSMNAYKRIVFQILPGARYEKH